MPQAPVHAWRVQLRDARGLSVTARAVGWLLSLYMDRDARAQVAVATLAGKLGVADRTVQRALRELESAGMLESRPWPGGPSRFTGRGDTRVTPADLMDGFWAAARDRHVTPPLTPVSPVLEGLRSTKTFAREERA